ncbi:MAG: alpha-1,2-fucosyltransferase [Crenarchaeota archaeon]|nr:alpha-1,2-fucosyltransferase [Thermoproteota archaeon]
MLILSVNGGLGNQMFQYALYTRLKFEGKKIVLDKSRAFCEMRKLSRCTIFDVYKLDKRYSFGCFRYLFSKVSSHTISIISKKIIGLYKELEVGKYDEKVLDLKYGYLDGYWQTEKYFSAYRDELLVAFKPIHKLTEKNERTLKLIQKSFYPVSIHVRMGDYNSPENKAIFGDICNEDYYIRAINYVLNKYTNPTFFLFSNEPNKAKDLLKGLDFIVINNNDEKSAWADMYLMSKCKCNIIANSTFSWWGAWLNTFSAKEIVAPKKWMNTREMPDIIPPEWTRL